MAISSTYNANLIANKPQNQDYIQKIVQNEAVEYKDFLFSQISELLAIRNPQEILTEEAAQKRAASFYLDYRGRECFVHFPWRKQVFRILGEKEYIELRTNRNRNKITKEEQELLGKKRIGIIGLSVGRSVATILARERICGSLRLADYDSLELSNLNRIGTGIPDLELNKAFSVCREIQEMDPFLDVEAFEEGVNEQNLRDFMLNPYKLDILIDECDSLEIKIDCRKIARELNIPVLMDTSDRGMLDVERFDLEPNRNLFHGKIDEKLNSEDLKDPMIRQRVLSSILDIEKVSERGRMSLGLIGKELLTWPQLASSVALGGALVAHTARRILLKSFTKSGRWYIDLNELIN